MVLNRIINWIGAAGLMAAPFFSHLPAGRLGLILALVLVTYTLARARIWPLVIANTVSIVGYLFSLTG